MFANGKRPPTVVRTVSLPVKKHNDKSRSSTPKPATPNAPSPKLTSHNVRDGKPTHTAKVKRSALNAPSVKSPPLRSVVSTLKRKAPGAAIQFDSDSDTEDPSDLDFALSSKRLRPDSPATAGAGRDDAQREIFDLVLCDAEDEKKWPIRHGAVMTNGEHAKEYRAAFGEGEQCTVRLRYPSDYPPER
jgi:hypothetical protein